MRTWRGKYCRSYTVESRMAVTQNVIEIIRLGKGRRRPVAEEEGPRGGISLDPRGSGAHPGRQIHGGEKQLRLGQLYVSIRGGIVRYGVGVRGLGWCGSQKWVFGLRN